ncbi:MAG: 2-hydroxyacyl-CoA dehydratase family protein [Thermincola sp.]|jgi:benzoyl-CoA reductase/2-hydroxyglutaryl-CoA dehydratase subunit BcrC/BadD/HgdB|nr:2-hydroxyacyl-CoA dehydratase family protein [Thermincola sp.]MDT3704930.1 2-hydroxyacyl-CoA dehydratase family protein [Thermincola sp.]
MAKVRPKLKADAILKDMMARYYIRAEEESGKNNLAWITAEFPVEILYAMNILPYYPENFAVKCASRRRADELMAVTEKKGFSQHLCSYARIGLGAAYWEDNPVERLPKPALLLPANVQCFSLPKWFELMAVHYKVPFFMLDTSFLEEGVTPQACDYFTLELHEMVKFLEQNTGKRLDYQRLETVLTYSAQACRLWNEILDLGALIPATLTCFDMAIYMAPIVTLRGTEDAVKFYSLLKEELLALAQEGVAAVPGEKYRIYWHGIPLWHRLRYFAEYFTEHKAAAVTALYMLSWGYEFDSRKGLATLAENYLKTFINRSWDYRIDQIIKIVDKYKIDGLVLFANHSCKSDTFGLYDVKKTLNKKLGLPVVVFEADMCDDRYFNEQLIKNKLDHFFEQM